LRLKTSFKIEWKIMKIFAPVGKMFLFAIICAAAALSPVAAFAAEEIKVPVTIALSHPIAGAQFKFHHTDGLEFVSFERSNAVRSAIMTPAVAKDGNIHIGFFGRDNGFIPQNGELDAGYLVFSYDGAPDQTLAMTEVKLVEVIDKDNTRSELITDVYEIKIPLADGQDLRRGFAPEAEAGGASPLLAIVSIAAVLLLAAACVVIVRQRRMLLKNRTS
jgi:hypothetical protein